MTVLECVDVGILPQNPGTPTRTGATAAAIRSVPGARSRFRSSLDRLAALVRPLMGGPADPGRPRQPLDTEADPALGHAHTLALAGRLATGLVHDFNNALLVAVASLDLIGEAAHDAALVQDQARAASDALRRASDVARQLMVLGRPDEGSRRQVDLGEIVRTTTILAEPLTRPGIELSVSRPPHALPVQVNPGQIERAILNLCLNARDAMPDGGTLHITTRTAIRWMLREDGGPGRFPATYAVVEVSDTGPGIPQHLQEKVFEPFFTTKPAGQGSGLGLAMVRETVVAHGGLVELTSDPLGTTVRILLPLC
jgi:two-component system cell cycle sensor histidine kinase/response regulator CckA